MGPAPQRSLRRGKGRVSPTLATASLSRSGPWEVGRERRGGRGNGRRRQALRGRDLQLHADRQDLRTAQHVAIGLEDRRRPFLRAEIAVGQVGQRVAVHHRMNLQRGGDGAVSGSTCPIEMPQRELPDGGTPGYDLARSGGGWLEPNGVSTVAERPFPCGSPGMDGPVPRLPCRVPGDGSTRLRIRSLLTPGAGGVGGGGSRRNNSAATIPVSKIPPAAATFTRCSIVLLSQDFSASGNYREGLPPPSSQPRPILAVSRPPGREAVDFGENAALRRRQFA